MKTNNVIICDSNIIFWILKRIILWEVISHSTLFSLSRKYDVYISEYIFWELSIVFHRDHNLKLEKAHIHTFFKLSWFYFHPSRRNIAAYISSYTSDPNDTQVLQDAIHIHAKYLLTKNIRDFNVEKIQKDFGIQVIDYILPEMLANI